MNSGDEKPVRPTTEQLCVDLRRLDWALELSEDTLTAITNTAEWVEFHSGQVVLEVESEITHIYFLMTGRVQSTLHDSLGKEVQKDTIVPGLALALLAIGSSGRSLLHIEAIEPSTAIKLTPNAAAAASQRSIQTFNLLYFAWLVNAFKRYVMVDRSLPKPSVVGIIHHSEASRSLVARLARRLRELDESPGDYRRRRAMEAGRRYPL